MIYRLATGAQSDLKQRLTSGILILAVTIGFPLLAAWLNRENLTLRPTNVAQTSGSGSVLGDSTSKGTSAPPTNTSSSVHTGAVPASSPITVRPAPKKPVATAPVPTVPETPVTPAPQTPAEATVTAPPADQSGSGGITLDVGVLDVVNAQVEVTPDNAGLNIGL